MDHALGIDPITQKEHLFSAQEYQERLDAGEPLKEKFQLVSQTELSPVDFIAGYKKEGHYRPVKAHFRRLAGYGLDEHYYDYTAKNKVEGLTTALNAGKKILLSLNLDLSYRQPHFDNPHESFIPHHRTRGAWVSKNHGNYVTVSIHNVKDAIKTILKVAAHEPDKSIKDRVFANYRGAVLPYEEFYLGRRISDLTKMYNSLANGEAGATYKQHHVVGMPRLINFVPTQTTLDTPGTKAIRGNVPRNISHCDQLIFAQEDIETTPEFKSLWENISKSMSVADLDKNGIFVLASPIVKQEIKGEESSSKWQGYTLWNISDIETQTTLPIYML